MKSLFILLLTSLLFSTTANSADFYISTVSTEITYTNIDQKIKEAFEVPTFELRFTADEFCRVYFEKETFNCSITHPGNYSYYVRILMDKMEYSRILKMLLQKGENLDRAHQIVDLQNESAKYAIAYFDMRRSDSDATTGFTLTEAGNKTDKLELKSSPTFPIEF